MLKEIKGIRQPNVVHDMIFSFTLKGIIGIIGEI